MRNHCILHRVKLFLCISLFAMCFPTTSRAEAEHPISMQVGWLEQIKLIPPDMVLHAKIDTGADSCSVHAENITPFNKKGKKWVSFELANRYGVRQTVARKVIRNTRVKTKRGGAQKRPVVRLGLCIGNYFEKIECNLVDRSHFSYPVLVGRNFLASGILVSSSDTYTMEPRCTKETASK